MWHFSHLMENIANKRAGKALALPVIRIQRYLLGVLHKTLTIAGWSKYKSKSNIFVSSSHSLVLKNVTCKFCKIFFLGTSLKDGVTN